MAFADHTTAAITPQQRWRTSVHEAAHAAVALALGSDGSATMVAFDDGGGVCLHSAMPNPRADAVVAAAGDKGSALATRTQPPSDSVPRCEHVVRVDPARAPRPDEITSLMMAAAIAGTRIRRQHEPRKSDGEKVSDYVIATIRAAAADNVRDRAAGRTVDGFDVGAAMDALFASIQEEAEQLVATHRDWILEHARAVYALGLVAAHSLTDPAPLLHFNTKEIS